MENILSIICILCAIIWVTSAIASKEIGVKISNAICAILWCWLAINNIF